MPAGIGLIVGVVAMLACMGAALAASFFPHLLGSWRVVALIAFCIGLLALITSGVLSIFGMSMGLRNRVHIQRFDEEHALMRMLASDVMVWTTSA